MEEVEAALGRFEEACLAEEKLDVGAREKSGMSDQDAVAVAEQATDAYMAGCAACMTSLSKLPQGSKVQALVNAQVRVAMERIDALQVLLEDGGSIFDKRASMTTDELQQLRDRARLSAPTDSDENKRTMVAKEILATETSYVKALDSLLRYYINPMTCGPLASVDPTDKVFGNVEEILGLARSFQSALEEKIAAWGPQQTLGDTFKKFAMFFKIYVMYTNSFQAGMKHATELIKVNAQAKAVDEAARAAGCQDIGSLMINPIQRLPRYVLLLKELRKRTRDSHPDARLVESALVDIQVVADHVNERLRGQEDNAKILEIQSKLWTTKLSGVPINLLEPGRRFIREGVLDKVRGIGTLREVHLFLFSDILMYCTSSKLWLGRYHYHNHLEYYGASRGEKEAQQLGASVTRPCFKVTSAQAVRVFFCNTVQECEEWMNLINECVKKKKDLDSRRQSLGRNGFVKQDSFPG